MEPINKFKKVYLNQFQNRWINIDEFGVKDKITLKTKNGKLETRTCQYWFVDNAGIVKCKIQYKGKVYFVTLETILED